MTSFIRSVRTLYRGMGGGLGVLTLITLGLTFLIAVAITAVTIGGAAVALICLVAGWAIPTWALGSAVLFGVYVLFEGGDLLYRRLRTGRWSLRWE